ncbi:regulator of protease activity HflC (stomatin/prohibitin superfamily) [Endobacter medicaginis]|uniref:Regulator of protease activity HflC (Stomatin/prohibitin superfamily) n=1 Tax=Endobacter medicaginis TaxID=1181271 RepID=A0A850NK13_9PROT|nr:slipin family protein [Endobacter medicaginis]MBB3173322.1 regulator of protease activity HflC (stomatin/prohibitin superfamily) [Endobacter medicaginis]MCX5475717.1 slipin family protein [Endobacter medicaginis]NVN28819.1 slipin family protein [Endobacter medicaginis]
MAIMPVRTVSAGSAVPSVAYIFSGLLVVAAVLVVGAGQGHPVSVVLAAVLVLAAIALPAWLKMVDQWQRAVVLRLGRYQGLRGPGLFFLIPFFETIAVLVDVRIRTTEIRAEEALTRDTVSIAMEAIVFWQVRDPAKAATEVENFVVAVEQVAQTSLREIIGARDLSALLTDRAAADAELRAVIARKTERWGVEVSSVEIKDIGIPPNLQDAMSRQAQAEREKQARETLASAEIVVAQKVREAAAIYAADPVALKLRQMNLVYEMNKERGTTILIPTELAAALGGVFTPP